MQSNQFYSNMCINTGITVTVGKKAKYQQKVESHKIILAAGWLCHSNL